ncbi:Hypothetical protein MSYG_1896 [Malassezia sympodialis ATCC 42132]|uniref:Nuclear speckle splicing regulatory protein 1 N-terminal domain-containing protein n=1 Tax=Malassezia sympodialis (strain ATCC 42132) TaxID=1230383 RepID=A0A1M8A5T3_MALS4|nr:Hypothetical protein MSYG_1896 [Malassezia sympodialis ATCC 42132]
MPPVRLSLPGARAPAARAPRPRAWDADAEEAPVSTPSSAAPVPVSKAVRKQQEEAEALDASTFDYDGVYDRMKAAERAVRQAKKDEDSARKPKYMSQFFEAAELRERDRLRAESKRLQREREAEGDAYAGKEAFVTSAYKAQQDEWKRAEEEERVREARARSRRGGVAAFRQALLNEEAERRQAAIEAASAAPPASSDAPGAADDVSDTQRADEARARGLHVELNDDRQIVDRRDLLQRGLNVVRKRKEPDAPREPAPPASASARARRSQHMEDELLARLQGDSDSE